MTLHDAKKSDIIELMKIPNGPVKMQLTRFGISEHSICKVIAISFGTVTIGIKNQQIALGRPITKFIEVRKCA